MKKLLVIIASAMFSFTTFSQTNKGTILIDAQTNLSGSFLTSKMEYNGQNVLDDDMKNTTISLAPSIGYFFANNFAAGLNLSVNINNTSMGNSEANSTTVAIGPFVRYYFGSSNVRPFIDGEIGYATNKEKNDGDELKFSGIGYGIGLGMAFLINEKIALNAGVSYLGTSLSNSEESNLKLKSSGVAIGLGFSVHL
ncbi:MAG TPA: outer membrane beta-barrel protein [Bacteroidales bacterium]|nr:outer membrane beta-barrel protein [Bacteroidales bacterium]